MNLNEIGVAIKERRKVLRVTQETLADLAGVHKNTLYKIEKGQLNPSIELLNKIIEILGMEIKIEIKNKLNE